MELANFEVENARLEELVHLTTHSGAFDGFTSRATMRLGPTLDLAARVVAPGGSALLWKGSSVDHEIAADRSWESRWDIRERFAIGTGPVCVVRFIRKTTE
jgi:16S rRNA G527 N7-methylase RsmG